MTTAGPNFISGITTAINTTDVVNKEYVDNKFGSSIPSQSGNSGEFLTTTDGTTTTWDYVSNYQEYTSVGNYTFTVPSQANLLYIEATGGGGGGSTGATGPTLAKSGLTWTLRTTGFGSTSITSLATNGSTDIASGNSGTLLSSTDDITWTLRTSGFGTSNINSLTYFNNEFLIGGRAPEVISWTLRTSGFGSSYISGLIYGNGFYVVSAVTGPVRVSTNGIVWTLRTSPAVSPWFDTDGGLYDGTNYFLYGGSTNAGRLVTSTDTINWTMRTSGFGTNFIGTISYGSGETENYIAGGASGILRSSTDSVHWTSRTSGFGTTNIVTSTYDGTDYWIANYNILRESTDGIAWTTRTTGVPNIYWMKINYANSLYVVAGSSGNIVSSTNGIEWTLRTSGFGSTIYALAYNSNLYVAGFSDGRLATSTDAITWITRTSNTTNIITEIVFGDSGWIASGDFGQIQSSTQTILSSLGNGSLLRASTDAVSWTTRTNNTLNSQTITLLASAGSYSFAHGTNYTGGYDFLNVSTDNITWQLRTSGFDNMAINEFSYDNNFYIAAGNNGILNVSTDTITWILRTSGTIRDIKHLVYGNSAYLYSTSNVSSIPNNLLGAASLTASTFATGTNDQGYWFLTLPWTIVYNEISYSGVFVETNSVITFGNVSISNPYSGNPISATFPPQPKILIQAADNSCQRIYYGTEGVAPDRTYRIRFEGTAATSGTLGSPNIVWEAIFYENNPSQIDIQTGVLGRSNGVSGAYTASSLIATGNMGPPNTGTRLISPYTASPISSSTDGISWTLRTSGFGSTAINTLSYSTSANNFIAAGDSGTLFSSSDAITWTVNTSNTTSNLLTSVHTNNTYLVAGASGNLTRALAQYSGTGGSGGSYTSWYIPKPIVTSNITVNVGSGGTGATTENTSGSAGAGTTISWTGPGGTCTLIANGGGAGGVAGIAQTNITSYYYTTAGGAGAALTTGVGVTATTQSNSFQPTGGGSGAGVNSSDGGYGGTINFYGNTAFSTGGNSSGSNGATGIAITSLPYGQGGGGGGAGASSAGSGGNGIRGAGGGGGAVISSAFGNGGNGGHGYARITWW